MRTLLALFIAVLAIANICDAQPLSQSEVLGVNRAVNAVALKQDAVGTAIGVLP
jgi:hypothetical protein